MCTSVDFELGRPFRPLEQLLGVLPPASARFLPTAWQPLMLDDNSPVKDLYPPTFVVDMNGARSSWEGIALIPFIDEERLLGAAHALDAEEVLLCYFLTCSQLIKLFRIFILYLRGPTLHALHFLVSF